MMDSIHVVPVLNVIHGQEKCVTSPLISTTPHLPFIWGSGCIKLIVSINDVPTVEICTAERCGCHGRR
jgi:hypothetical protein